MMEALMTAGAYLFGTTMLVVVALLGWLAIWAMFVVLLFIPFLIIYFVAKAKGASDARKGKIADLYLVGTLILASPAVIIAPIKLYQNGNVPGYHKATMVEIVTLKSEVRRYKLLAYNPPKHFYVDLRDVQTGQLYERTYVSKHCNSYVSLELGGEYNLRVSVKQQGEKTWLVFDNLYEALCT